MKISYIFQVVRGFVIQIIIGNPRNGSVNFLNFTLNLESL